MIIIVVALVWCILGGQGGFWYQSGDWDSRNALFRDLITHNWPVKYSSDGGNLCYYVAHWIPSAAFGKLLLRIGMDLSAAWCVANIALLCWTALGIVLAFLLVIVTIRPKRECLALVCVLITVFFATPDILGIWWSGGYPLGFEAMHLEWWAKNMQFSSLTTCLFWVFNQAVIPWLCTLCIINERSMERYLLIWVCCFFAGPLPSVGLAMQMVGQGIHVLASSNVKQKGLRSLASFGNAVSVPIALVFTLYYMNNGSAAADAAGEWAQTNALPFPFYFPTIQEQIVLALVFLFVEGLMLPLVLRLLGVKGPLLTSAAVTLLVCPFVRFSWTADFCMRASVPAVITLCVLSIGVVMGVSHGQNTLRKRIAIAALLVLIILGSVTPIYEFHRGFQSVLSVGIEESLNDPFITFEGRDGWPRTNFVVREEDAKSIYWRYISM